jgi:predicted transcriptional regulator
MKMSTVTIGVASLSDTHRHASAAFRGKKQGARISFASEDLLWKTLTPKRWALLKLMARQGSMAIREIARRVGRDVRAVHSDIHVLLRAGILEKVAEGGVVFPYDAIHVDFLLRAA